MERPDRAPLLEVRDLVKDFGEHLAVDGISFDVAEGEVFGFIGPNGAGKTTTIRIIATLLEPTSGEVRIGGYCVQNDVDEVRRILGYMPDHFGVYDGLTVEEYLEFFARAYRVPPAERRVIIEDVMELTDLGPLRRRLVSTFSKGMKQRLCLAKTLIHDPKLLVLDEPASGLDPRARIEFRTLLKTLQEMGKTILISSHILTELSDVCTSVGIIERGRLVECGSVDKLERLGREFERLEILLHEPRPEAVELVRRVDGVVGSSCEGARLRVDWQGGPEEIWQVIRALVDNHLPVVEVKRNTRNLEHLFLELTKGDVS